MTFHIFTYFNQPEKAVYLMDTAKLHRLQVENLCTTSTWNGFQDRILAIYEKLKTLPEDDIVCCVDSYDILVNSSAERIVEMFKQENCEILYGSEMLCYPFHINSETYPTSPTPFRYLNAGCYIGYVRSLRKLFSDERMKEVRGKTFGGPEDQGFMQTYFLENHEKDNVKLNTSTSFALNMNKVPWSDLTIQIGHVHYDIFKTTPCFLHFNGMSYLDLNKDYVKTATGSFSFDYYKVYDRLFKAILNSKILTDIFDTCVKLTGRGSTY
jgi:hypothetical protein